MVVYFIGKNNDKFYQLEKSRKIKIEIDQKINKYKSQIPLQILIKI